MSDPALLQSLLVDAGFQMVNVQPVMGTMRFSSAENLVRSYGALGSFPADESQQAAAIEDVTKALLDYVCPDGLVYPIEAVLGRGK